MPGLYYVVTEVFQVIGIPIWPLGGYLVWEGSEEQSLIAGIRKAKVNPISLSWKSFGWAWLRVLMLYAGLFGVIGVLPLLLDVSVDRAALIFGQATGVILLVVLYRTRYGLRARRERALALAATVGLSAEVVDEFLAAREIPRAVSAEVSSRRSQTWHR